MHRVPCISITCVTRWESVIWGWLKRREWMIGWLWANGGELALGKINIALAQRDVNMSRSEVMLLYQTVGRAHAEHAVLFRYGAKKMNSQWNQMWKKDLGIVKGLIWWSSQRELKEHGLLSLAVFRGDITISYKSIRIIQFFKRGYCHHKPMDRSCELISAGNQENFSLSCYLFGWWGHFSFQVLMALT